MLLVAITTSTAVSSIALGDTTGLRAHAVLRRPCTHAEFLAPAIEFCLKQAGVRAKQISGVALDRGPGLFTGLRVGIATAKGVSLAVQVPVAVFTSLDLLAFGVRHAGRDICTVVDARRGEVFCGLYRPTPGGVERDGDYRVCSPEALASDLFARGEEVLLAGDGAHVYRDIFREVGHVTFAGMEHAYPSAEVALELAFERFEKEEFVPSSKVQPLYMRRSDSELRSEQ